MTDGRLMDADCIHGVAWFECRRCGLEQRPQRQDSLTDQLADLHRVAVRLGMYDAADWLWKQQRDHLSVPDTGAEPEPTFVFYGTFDALAAHRGWYDHRCYRWVVYSLDEPVPDTGAEPGNDFALDAEGYDPAPPLPDTGAEP